MMGALDFQDTWQTLSETKGLAVPRLRDDRHRNLQAYAAMNGQSILILDPGKCCAGTPVNGQCANRIVEAVKQAQLTVVLPTEVEGVERVHANEKTMGVRPSVCYSQQRNTESLLALATK